MRLFYMGNTFINNHSYQGRLKENTQLGAELVGDNSVAADAEVLALVVDSLRAAGLKEFQIGVGHMDFFHGLIQAAEIEEEMEQELITLISNKNFFGVEELVDSLHLCGELKELFSLLGNLCMTDDLMNRAKELSAGYPVILKALERLDSLMQVLSCYGVENYVSIELGMLSTYHYYTGIIFSGYTFGSGEPIVKGGRYDKLMDYFGKHAPSIGFAVVIDQLLAALARQKIEIPVENNQTLIVYREEKQKDAIARAVSLREQELGAALVCWEDGKTEEDYRSYAQRMHMQSLMFIE